MRAYLYHKTKPPIIVNIDDMPQYSDWEESPLPFVKTTDFGVNPEDVIKVQLLGESIMGVNECINGLLNLELMSMKELKSFAEKYFKGIKARSKKALIEKIRAENDNSSGHS